MDKWGDGKPREDKKKKVGGKGKINKKKFSLVCVWKEGCKSGRKNEVTIMPLL